MTDRKIHGLIYSMAILLIVPLALCLTGTEEVGAAESEVVKLSYGTVGTPKHFAGQAIIQFAERVKELSGGTLEIELHLSGALGGERDILEMIQLGSVDMFCGTSASLGIFIPAYKCFALPFLVTSTAQYDDFIASKYGKKISTDAENAGFKLLMSTLIGFRNIGNNLRPITKLADVKGMRFRTMENEIQVDTMRALGGDATPLPLQEAYPALQTGLVDGGFNDFGAFVQFEWREVLKYGTGLPLFSSYQNVVISPKVWGKLRKEHQAVLMKAVGEQKAFLDKAWVEGEKQYAQELQDQGYMKINYLDPSEYPAFTAACKPVFDKLLKKSPELSPYIEYLVESGKKN